MTMKARWEENRLMQRFEGYAGYAARTPRFVPRLRR
jgi:protein-S-isoprenylcysteine O-methyltransferase Ste14